MQRHIIQFAVRRCRHGWEISHRTIDADNIHEAHKLAVRRSFRAGCLAPHEMRETTWATPYDRDLAEQLDLLPYEPIPAHLEAAYG